MSRKLRSHLFTAYLIGSAGLVGVFCLPALVSRNATLAVGRAWNRSVLTMLRVICGLDYEIRGNERLPTGPGLVAAKHSSEWETIALAGLLPRPCFVLKKELARVPLLGWYARRAGFIFVDRADGARALRSMTEQARRAKAEGAQVVIFPEGTRSPVGRGGRYHPGVAALSRALDLPVVPVAHDAGVHWRGFTSLRRPGRIRMDVLAPIPAGTPRKELMARLESAIEPATRALEAAPATKDGRR